MCISIIKVHRIGVATLALGVALLAACNQSPNPNHAKDKALQENANVASANTEGPSSMPAESGEQPNQLELAGWRSELPVPDPAMTALAFTNASLPVDERVDAIMEVELTKFQKAEALMIMLPTLNEEGQREVAHSLVKQIDNVQYAYLKQFLMNPKMDETVLSVFMTDLLKRQNGLKIPLLLELAQVNNHPMQAEAKELLGMYFNKDHGDDWNQWERTMVAWLKTHANDRKN